MNDRKKLISAAAAVVISAILVCSAVFMISESDHNCIGSDCPVCAQLAECGRLLGTAIKPAAVFAAVFALIFCAVADSFRGILSKAETPVSLKNKLIN